MNEKQRILTLPDFGTGFDSGMNTSGTSTGMRQMAPGEIVKDGTLHRMFYSLPDNFYQEVPVYAGKEVFSSTNRKRPLYNDCYHLKNTWRCTLLGYAFKVYPYDWDNMYQFVAKYRFQDTVRLPVADSSLKLPDVDLFFKQRAWASMQPRFHGEVSMVNFLFELKDFSDISKRLFKIATGDTLFRLAKEGKQILKQDPGLTAAQGILAYNFAIKPLVADIAAIILQAKDSAEAAYTKFVQAGTERGASHYSEYLKDVKNLSSPGYYSPDVRGSISTIKQTATLERKYTMCPLSSSEIFSQFWGLSWTLEAIWNALPFSFLVDYFVAIGQSLKFATQQKGVDLNTLQYCESVLAVNQSGVFLNPQKYTVFWDHNGFRQLKYGSLMHVSGYSSTCFKRYVTSPTIGLVVPRIKTPTGTQMLNMAALLRTMF